MTLNQLRFSFANPILVCGVRRVEQTTAFCNDLEEIDLLFASMLRCSSQVRHRSRAPGPRHPR